MAMRASSSSSSFSNRSTYDVFLSFRGKDTRYGFTGNLYKALRDRGIHTFIDEKELRKGDEITPTLEKAIEESRIFIIVLSQNYASSLFCLKELAYILNFTKGNDQLVLPIFHNVDPFHVRYHTGSFGEALANHEKKLNADNMEMLNTWKMALHQVANLSGYHFKHGARYEYEFIQKIVDLVSNKISCAPLHVADYPVGLHSPMLKVKALLHVGSDDVVHMVGIHGLGGVGKTTLAVAIYNSIAGHFEGLCFLEKVRETSNKHGLQHLQSSLLSQTVEKVMLTSVKQGISEIQHRLQQKKVLLVLDDVDKLEQLQAIAGRADWFGLGSRVIITTRDKQLLARHGVKRTYEVKELNEEDARQLLSWKAFNLENDKVDPCYEGVFNRAITYASGLPLALKVIGSNLFGKNIEQWESALNRYKRIPDREIQDILKVSYDALEEDEQSVFLDIACCFKEYQLATVEDILHAHHGHCMKHHVGVLVEKSLIRIGLCGNVTLHDLIEDMGKEIVRKESPKDPGKRSRLWFSKDIVQVLEENTGTSQIEIIHMDFPLFKKEVEWDGDAFKKMKNLKTLVIRNGFFSKGPNHLPNALRVLEWRRYPSQNLPYGFDSKRLTICKLSESCFTSLNLTVLLLKMKLGNLTSLSFNECQCLTEIPDVSFLPHLKNLSFELCKNLLRVHDSVGLLEKLKILNAYGCHKLKSFPPIKLSSLEQLELSCCDSLECFPEILGKMENITRLLLQSTSIKKIPLSFQKLIRLRVLHMGFKWNVSGHDAAIFIWNICMMPELANITISGWKGLLLPKEDEGGENISSTESSNVRHLSLRNCNVLDDFFPTALSWFVNIEELSLPWNNFTVIPECIKECHFLTSLNLDYCEHLREIRGIPPNLKCFSAKECLSLTSSCRSMLLNQELHEAGNTIFYLPGAKIPEWFEGQTQGLPISFWFRNKFPAIAICVVMGPEGHYSLFRPIVIINGNKHLFKSLSMGPNRTCLSDLQEIKLKDNLDESILKNDQWNHAEIVYEDLYSVPVLIKSGIHVLKQKSSIEDIQFTNPCTKRKSDDDLDSSESQNQLLLKKTKISEQRSF